MLSAFRCNPRKKSDEFVFYILLKSEDIPKQLMSFADFIFDQNRSAAKCVGYKQRVEENIVCY